MNAINNKTILWGAAALIATAALSILALRHPPEAGMGVSRGQILQVVAGENFWGSLISQLGGSHVHVLSIVSDPNADPHEYASTTDDARAVANADYAIFNGAGYDSWGDKLLGASQNPNRRVLDIASLLGKKEGDNPHFFYSPAYVNKVVLQMESDLVALDPADTAYYRQQYVVLSAALAAYQNRIIAIKHQFGGTKVAATEDIFKYLADAAGLDLVSPPAFMLAVAEGNDPPAASVAEFERLLGNGEVRVLVYNQQTITPLTVNIEKMAADRGMGIVGITEIITPPNLSFQVWMNGEVIELQNALSAKASGR
jgi:zinc/manganese transport system substrate-binding protein